MSDLLQLSKLNAWYGSKQVLHDVDLAIPQTGCTVLLGPCGTGKSTLLRCIDAFSHTTNHEVADNGLHAKIEGGGFTSIATVDWIKQKGVRPDLDALRFFCEDQTESAANVLESLRNLCSRLELDDMLGKLFVPCKDLTQAEWAMFSILRSVIRGASLVLLDEPLAGVEDSETAWVIKLIQRLSQTRAIVLITHHQGQAKALGQQIILMGNGRLLEAGQQEQFFAQPQSDQARHFVTFGTLPEEGNSKAEVPVGVFEKIDAALAALEAGRPLRSGKMHPFLPSRFRWVVPDVFAGVSVPGYVNDVRQDLSGLQAAGITSLFSLMERPFEASLAAEFGIESLYERIVDMAPPTLMQAIDLCATLDRVLSQGRCIAVHCKAGQGRTGTVAAMYLMWCAKGKWTGEQGIRAARLIDPVWIQSKSQIVFLEAFGQFITRNVTFA